jgi:dTDP-4-dehydrorhamnose 3,5-epimerase
MVLEPAQILGSEHAVKRRSHITANGRLAVDLIDGLRYRRIQPVSHNDGHVTEIIQSTWDIAELPIVQVHLTTTFPGRVRGWGLHHHTVDRLFVASGSVRLVCYDGRKGSPTYGRVNEFFFSDRNPGLLMVPLNVYHGWKNIGNTESLIISMPSQIYNHEDPDGDDLPWDSPAAREMIPYTW